MAMGVDMEVDDFVTKSQTFVSWLEKSGVTISDKIELADLRSRGAGRGVVAKVEIAEDEVLFTVPRTSILSPETSNLPKNITAGLEDPWLSLILDMVYENQQRERSKWRPYLDILPREFDTLMFWDEDMLNFLKGSAVLSKIGKDSANESFTTRLLPIIRSNNDLYNTKHVSDPNLLELCHRMASTIMAYGFDLPSQEAATSEQEDGWEVDSNASTAATPKGMIPLADLLNANADLNNAKLYHTPDAVEMRSIKPISAGDELFNDYGPLPRADLLRRYGYTTDEYAKYDVVEITEELIFLPASKTLGLSTQVLQERLDYLEEHDVLDTAYDISHCDSKDLTTSPFPEELTTALNTFALSTQDFKTLKTKSKLPKPDPSEKTCDLLRAMLERRGGLYLHNTYTQDQNEIDDMRKNWDLSKSGAKRRLMAFEVLCGEKQVLAGARDWTEERRKGWLLEGDNKRQAEEKAEGQRMGKRGKK
ncbi:Ribosomal lysine N-methyltransferase 4 [Oleoguttula sp. CCFEE 5521]